MKNRQQKEYATHSCKIMQMNFWIFFVWKTDWCMDFQFFRKNFYWFFCFGFSADENPLSMQCVKFLLLMLLWWYSKIDKESFFFLVENDFHTGLLNLIVQLSNNNNRIFFCQWNSRNKLRNNLLLSMLFLWFDWRKIWNQIARQNSLNNHHHTKFDR